MAPKNKGQKMGLGAFLADETLGPAVSSSWADEMEDMPTVSSSGAGGSSGYGSRRDHGGASSGNDRYGSGDRGDRYSSSRDDSDRYPPRAQLPIPDKPPYTAYVGNLPFDIAEGEISDYFGSCEPTNVRLVRDRDERPKGFGYVEFGTREGLVAALDMNGTQLAARTIRVSVAEPPKERADDRTAGEWRRTGPLPPMDPPARRSSGYERHGGDSEEGGRRQSTFNEGDGKVRDFGNWERRGPLSPLAATSPTGERGRGSGEREFRRRSPAPSADGESLRAHGRDRPHVDRQPSAAERDNEWRRGARPEPPQRSTPTSPVIPHTRPKLELKKRSEQPVDTTVTPSSDKPNPFGAARPIDTMKREKEIEEKRAKEAAERKAREEKAREEKAAAEARAEAKSPVSTKDMGSIRRASITTTEGAPIEEKEKEKEQAKEKRAEKKPERPKGPDNWRRGPAKEQPKQEAQTEGDGWSTVAPKRGGRGSGGRAVSAQ